MSVGNCCTSECRNKTDPNYRVEFTSHQRITIGGTHSVNELLDIVFVRTWWSYSDGTNPAFSKPYHWFNLFEGWVWILCGLAVFLRYLRNRHSELEVNYAVAFVLFGLTDFREAYAQSSWLLWLKLFNLIALSYLRHLVITRYYPRCKLI